MATVSITDLKSNLAHYLLEVRRGREIQVVDGGMPVACNTPDFFCLDSPLGSAAEPEGLHVTAEPSGE